MEEKKDYRKELFYEKKNGYDLMDKESRAAMEEYCEGYKAYLNYSRTEREAVTNAISLAEREGFVEYAAGMALKAGDKVWFNNRGKALMLAVVGKKPMSEGVVVAAAHVDAPRLDLKQTPLYEDNELAFFKTHYYGGIKKYQWTAIRRGHRRRNRPGEGRAAVRYKRPAAAPGRRPDEEVAGRGRHRRGPEHPDRFCAL